MFKRTEFKVIIIYLLIIDINLIQFNNKIFVKSSKIIKLSYSENIDNDLTHLNLNLNNTNSNLTKQNLDEVKVYPENSKLLNHSQHNSYNLQNNHHKLRHNHHGNYMHLTNNSNERNIYLNNNYLESSLDIKEQPLEVFSSNTFELNSKLIDSSSTIITNQTQTQQIILKCPKCSANNLNDSNNSNKFRISKEELTELRIDFVKQQILQKLRLKEKPLLSSLYNLPKPIIQRDLNEMNSKKNKINLDDYYARTSKKFIILERETKECSRFNKNPAICFTFKLNEDLDFDLDNIDVNQAVLWLYLNNGRNLLNSNKLNVKQTLMVSEIDQQQFNSKYLVKVKPIAMATVEDGEGWTKIDIAWPIRKWVGTHDLSHFIHISCESCTSDEFLPNKNSNGLIALNKENQPFIVIDTKHRRGQRSRQKRNVNCTAGITECCREKLYVSFKEIGWDDWIIQPKGYDAYFCRGSCSTVASLAASNTHHSSLISKLVQIRGSTRYVYGSQSENSGANQQPLELIPCCTAKQFSSLQLFYRDSNNTVTLKTLPNMVIESCGCM